VSTHGREIRLQALELALAKACPSFVKKEAELNELEGVDRAPMPAHGF
jgi:hypothetical protein